MRMILPHSTAGRGRSLRRFAMAAAFLGAFLVPAAAAQASVLPPTLQIAAPNPPAMQVGGVLHLTVTVTNPDPSTTENNISTTITLPAGLSVTSAAPFCNDGSVNTFGGATTISLTGTHLTPGNSCTFGVNITATTTGTKKITSDAISSTESGPGTPVSQQVFVLVPRTIATVFGAPSIAVGSSTTATFTIANPNGLDLNGVAFNDALPSGLTVST